MFCKGGGEKTEYGKTEVIESQRPPLFCVQDSGLNSTNCIVYLVGVPMRKSEMESVKSSLKEIISFDELYDI